MASVSFTRIALSNLLKCSNRLFSTEFKFKGFDAAEFANQVKDNPNKFKLGYEYKINSDLPIYPDYLGECQGKFYVEGVMDLLKMPRPGSGQYIDESSTKERPSIIYNDVENFQELQCLCAPYDYMPVFTHLTINTTKRCMCGHWFRFMEAQDYYKQLAKYREESYNEIKDSALMKKLEKEYDEINAKFEELLNKSYDEIQNKNVFGTPELREEMKKVWDSKCVAFNRCVALLDLPKSRRPNLELIEESYLQYLETPKVEI